MTDSDARRVRRSARAVLAVGVLAGLVLLVDTLAVQPEQVGIASDVYYHAGRAVLAGEDVYAAAPPDRPGYTYIYPPIVVLAFLPHALLGSEAAALALQTVLNAAAGIGVAAVVWRGLRRRGLPVERVDAALLVGFFLLSAHALLQIVQGQVTLWLALAFAVGFDALERGRERIAGAVFAAAALVKLFPAAMGLWLLRRRAWTAAGVAVATGVGGLVAGVLVFGPDPTVEYLTGVLVDRFRDQTFAGTPDPTRTHTTVRRQLAALLPLGSTSLTPVAAAALAPFLAVCYRRIDTDERRLAAVLATVVATIMFFPFQPLYFSLLAYPLVLSLYRLRPGRPRRLLIGGTLLTYVFVGHETVELAVAAVPLPEAVADATLAVSRATFSVILPPTAGMWLVLVGCVLVQFSEPTTARTASAAAVERTD